MKHVILGLFAAVGLMVAGPAAAKGKLNAQQIEELKDFAEDGMKTQCFGALKDAVQQNIGPKYQAMRGACAQFRGCKKTCRQAKRNANKGVRQDFRANKKDCRKLKGKAKRDCKKNARKGKRAGKKDNRQAKRNCKQSCKAQYLQGPCKNARKAFWKEIAKTVKENAGQCAKDIQALING